jgi:hypothetical protein
LFEDDEILDPNKHAGGSGSGGSSGGSSSWTPPTAAPASGAAAIVAEPVGRLSPAPYDFDAT